MPSMKALKYKSTDSSKTKRRPVCGQYRVTKNKMRLARRQKSGPVRSQRLLRNLICIPNATRSNQRLWAAVHTHDLIYIHRILFGDSVENKFVGRESYNCKKWRVLSDSYCPNSRERTLSCTKVERVDRNRGKHTDSRNALEYADSGNRFWSGIWVTKGYKNNSRLRNIKCWCFFFLRRNIYFELCSLYIKTNK